MLASALAACLARDLRSLRGEIEAYPDERQIWKIVPGITNSAGTLTLHLAGNLQHYIGMHLGGSSYVRDRPAEFARRDVPRAELLKEIAAAEHAIVALGKLDDSSLKNDFPEAVGGAILETGELMVHMTVHFTFHLGQVGYHRRMVTGQNTVVPAMRPAELATARLVK